MISGLFHRDIVASKGVVMRSTICTCAAGFAAVILLGQCSGVAAWAGSAGESEWVQIARPLDVPAERLERPRPEQDRPSRPVLSQSEVIKLAKAEAKKELGKGFDAYEVKAAIFDASTGLWSVTFDRTPPDRSSSSCVVVFVHDNDKAIDLRHCK